MLKLFNLPGKAKREPNVQDQDQASWVSALVSHDKSIEKKEDPSWQEFNDGELLVDVYERPEALVIRSFVAGVTIEDLEINVYNDILTIRGVRREYEEVYIEDFHFQECYWGDFSRTIILPIEVQSDKIKAYLKNGLLKIVLPKKEPKISVEIKSEQDFLNDE